MSFAPIESLLLLVDFQSRLMPWIEGDAEAVANALRLAGAAKLLEVPVLATEQNPAGLGPNVDEIRNAAAATLEKRFFDATREPRWPEFAPRGRKHVVVAGCEAHVGVMQTVIGLLGKGYAVRLVADAVGSRTAESRRVALERAASKGAEIVTTEMVIFEWLVTCDHPRFREILQIVK